MTNNDTTKQPTTEYFTGYYQNPRGLRTKSTDFYLASQSANYDFMALAETWWTTSHLDSEYFSADYIVYRKDRSETESTHSRGGGVAIAVKSKLQSSMIVLSEKFSTLESVCVRICCNGNHFIVYCCYIPPNTPIETYELHLQAIRHLQCNEEDTLLILGDFNLPKIVWTACDDDNVLLPSHIYSEKATRVIDFFSSQGYSQMNGTKNSDGKTLDLLFASSSDNILVTKANIPLSKVDKYHPPIEIFMDTYSNILYDIPAIITIYDYERTDYGAMNSFFANYDTADALNTTDIDSACASIYNMLLTAIDLYTPRKSIRSRNHPPWYNRELLSLKNKKNAAHRKANLSKTIEDKRLYEQARTIFQVTQKYLFDIYMVEMEAKIVEDPKKFWQYVNLKRKTSGFPSSMSYKDRTVSGCQEVCDLFAAFFRDTYIEDDNMESTSAQRSPPLLDIGAISFTEEEVRNTMMSLNTKKSTGPDNIHPSILKSCAQTLAPQMTSFFNRSLELGRYPEAFKIGHITPIYKSGLKNVASNYRAVSVLPTVAKLFDSLMANAIMKAAKSIITSKQHGFMSGRSTATNLLLYSHYVINALEDGSQVDAIYTDFKKAFDRVKPSILIRKLGNLGIHSAPLRWIKSYLTNRRQCVKISGYKSNMFEVTSGLVQGSHLGPILFLLFINDIVDHIEDCHVLLFADDLKIYTKISSISDSMRFQAAIGKLEKWCDTNQLHLNFEKCKIITFARQRNSVVLDYILYEKVVSRVNEIVDLGVTIDSKFSFDKHVEQIISKAKSKLGFLKRICWNMRDVYALKSIYCSLVRSTLEYCNVVWNPYYAIHSQHIESIQKQFILYALRHLNWPDRINLPSYVHRCQLIDIETLERRRTNACLLFMFDLFTFKIDADDIRNKMIPYDSTRPIRSHLLFKMHLHRTNYGINEPINRIICISNKIAAHFSFTMSREIFKKCIKSLPLSIYRN